MHKSFSQDHPFLEPTVSFFAPSFSFNFFLHFRALEWDFLIFYPLRHLWLTLERFLTSLGMWMWHIAMRAISLSINVLGPTRFFPLMAILEGGVRFLMDLLLLSTLRFYGLCPDQLPPNFDQVVSCVSRLNQIYGLQLNHHDINFMYSLCGNLKTNYYLKARNVQVRLISCLPDSKKNSVGEYVQVSGNWLVDKVRYPLSPRDVSWYQALLILFVMF